VIPTPFAGPRPRRSLRSNPGRHGRLQKPSPAVAHQLTQKWSASTVTRQHAEQFQPGRPRQRPPGDGHTRRRRGCVGPDLDREGCGLALHSLPRLKPYDPGRRAPPGHHLEAFAPLDCCASSWPQAVPRERLLHNVAADGRLHPSRAGHASDPQLHHRSHASRAGQPRSAIPPGSKTGRPMRESHPGSAPLRIQEPPHGPPMKGRAWTITRCGRPSTGSGCASPTYWTS
jgi:hypothetical protein